MNNEHIIKRRNNYAENNQRNYGAFGKTQVLCF